MPRCSRCCSSAVAMVDLPEAESPVSQMVRPGWARRAKRAWRESEGCQVMLLPFRQFPGRGGGTIGGAFFYVAILMVGFVDGSERGCSVG
jgi:hypothetical protein